MKIREATLDDELIILDIHKKAIEAGCKDHYSEEQISSWATPQELPPYAEQLNESLYLIAEDTDKCIGFGSINKSKPEIETLFVIPEYFGKGIGSEILIQLEKSTNLQSHHKIQVDSTMNAVSFYERHGYKKHSECVHIEPDGTEIQCTRMIKEVVFLREHPT